MRNNIFISLLTVAVVVLLYLLLSKQENQSDVVPDVVKESVKADVENIVRKIDREGFQHAVISDKENVVRKIKELDSAAIKELDSVKVLLGIKDKQLKHYITYSTTLEGKLLQAEQTDTSFRYEDKWANIEYVISKDTLSAGHFNFKYNADISYAEYWNKKHFLAQKKHYIDFWIADPRAQINGVKRVKIESKKPAVLVDVNASGYYTDRLNVGIDAGINISRARIGAGYFYDMEENKWRALMSAKFKILEF